MSAALSSLKDIPGVFGSFVFAPDGAHIARDMPAVYSDSLFTEISRRLEGIAEAMEPALAGYYELLAKFDGHWLLSRRTPKGTLNVLVDESVNFPALKMAANVAVKHLDKLEGTAPTPTPEAIPVPVVVPVVKAPPPIPPEHRPRRVWRGQVVE
jgi:predicted regulator of Ras-like GTPase activity (Roadblock/LC7/MglB family)